MIYVQVCLKYVHMSICMSAIYIYEYAHIHTHIFMNHLDLTNSSWLGYHCLSGLLSVPAACH